MTDGVEAFKAALEENGITVDSVMNTGAGLSLMYVHDPDEKVAQVSTIALVYAAAPQVAPMLSVTPLTSAGRDADRVANFAVERSQAQAYNADECSKKAYVRDVLSTWERFA